MVIIEVLVELSRTEGYGKCVFEDGSVDSQEFQSRLVTSLQLRDSIALVADILHILPPMLRMLFPNEMLSDLLVEYQSSVG